MVLLVFLAFLEEEVVLDFQAFQAFQALQAFLEEEVVLDYFRISYVQDGGGAQDDRCEAEVEFQV